MAGGRLAGMAIVAAAGVLNAAPGAQLGPGTQPSPFGGSTPVHIAHVGRIELDLAGPAGEGTLARVRCVVATPGTACFVARSR